jgi:hypothetical protein
MFSLWTLPTPNIRGERYLLLAGLINIEKIYGLGKGYFKCRLTHFGTRDMG